MQGKDEQAMPAGGRLKISTRDLREKVEVVYRIQAREFLLKMLTRSIQKEKKTERD